VKAPVEEARKLIRSFKAMMSIRETPWAARSGADGERRGAARGRRAQSEPRHQAEDLGELAALQGVVKFRFV